MKKITLLLAGAGLLGGVHAQSMEYLDVNNVKAAFWSDGSMFWDKTSAPLFEWPQNSGTHLNYINRLWIGGLVDSTLHGAYMNYQAFGTDYWPGPLTQSGTIDSNTIALYDKVWKISREDIYNFQVCYCLDPGLPQCAGYQIPASIMDWPGNPLIEADGDHLVMDQQLAPFYDYNSDGVYNPMDCDYPDIKCDQALFFVFNDAGGMHTESFAEPLGIQLKALAYACACDSMNIGIDDAVFLDLDISYKGNVPVQQTYISLTSDADIGGSMDDYLGTNVDLGYVYHYNGDNFDNTYQSSTGYGSLPPAHAMVFLEGPWMDENGAADFWDPSWNPANPPSTAIQALQMQTDTSTQSIAFGINGTGFSDGIVDNEKLGLTRTITTIPFNSDPISPWMYYKYQRCFWPDNSKMTYGGTGYMGGPTATSANFIFPYESDAWNWGTGAQVVTFPWSEFFPGGPAHPLGDRRSISSTGPFTMNPGESNKLTFAFVNARSTDPVDSVSIHALETTVRDIRHAYFAGTLGQCNYHVGLENIGDNIHIKLFPNPSTGLSWVSSDALEQTTLQIFDITGRLMQTILVAEGQTSMPIVTDNYAPGIYIVQVLGKGWKKSLRLVKS